MSETPEKSQEKVAVKATVNPTPPAFTFDKSILLKRIQVIQENLEQHKGQPGMNPYMWIARHITPLVDRIYGKETAHIAPETSRLLHDEVMKLPLNPTPSYGPQSDTNPSKS